MRKVLIPTKLDGIAAEMLQNDGAYEVVQDTSKPFAELVVTHPETYALIVRSEEVTPTIIDTLPELKLIVRAGAGYNTIDVVHARKKGIDVMNTPGANSNAVAEEVIALILADARHIVDAERTTREGLWEKKRFMGRELAHKCVGIVGLGSIGRLVAKRLGGFDVKLLGYDPLVPSERAREFDVEWADLQTIFKLSDYITLHIPENDETRGIVDERLLTSMKEGATLVNCARSGIIDEDALRRVKTEKNLRFLNDVYSVDEAGPKSVADIADLMMPHIGANTVEANRNAARSAAQQIIDLDKRGITSFIVNRDIPEGLDRSYCQLAHTLANVCRHMVGRTSALKIIETSFYGELTHFADWLLVPVVAGIWEDFEPGMDFRAARVFLDANGIEYVNRSIDDGKTYGNAITVDLTSELDSDVLRHISLRGTIAEGNLTVSRINEFDKLYFEPAGDMLMFLYDDRPGVIGAIGAKLAGAGINIEDMRNPHDTRTNRSLVIMKINKSLSESLVSEIRETIDAISAFSFSV